MLWLPTAVAFEEHVSISFMLIDMHVLRLNMSPDVFRVGYGRNVILSNPLQVIAVVRSDMGCDFA